MVTKAHPLTLQVALSAEALATFDLPVSIKFQTWLASVLTGLQATEPHLQLADLRVGVLTSPVDELPIGTPLVEYPTEAGLQRLAFPQPHTVPAASVAARPIRQAAPAPGMLGNPFMLGLAKQLGMVLGKSLLKELDPKLYEVFFGKSTDEVVKQHIGNMTQELKDFLRDLDLNAKQDDFIKVRGWLRDTYSVKLQSLAAGKHVNAHLVMEELNAYQGKMQNLAEVIEQRLPDELLLACDYSTRLKVELHRLAYLQRLVLMAARIYWYRLANNGQAEDSLEEEFRQYAQNQLAASQRMAEKLAQGRYGKIAGPYHLNATQYDDERRRYLGEGGLFFAASWPMTHYYNWRDDFESHRPGDPFGGAKMYRVFSYDIIREANPVGWLIKSLPWAADAANAQEETATRLRAQQDRDKHFEAVKKLFEQEVSSPAAEARQQVEAALAALEKLQSEGIVRP